MAALDQVSGYLAKYNYGEIVSRLKGDYPDCAERQLQRRGSELIMKALVIGSGGREHAILWALERTSTAPLKLYCAPGNGGISELAECVPISASDHKSLIEFAETKAIDMTDRKSVV